MRFVLNLVLWRESSELKIFRSRAFGSGKGIEVELKLPFVPTPDDDRQRADLGCDVSEEPDQSDEEDQIESIQKELGTMSLKPKRRSVKVR